ncbi:terminase large subunit domain-containing protein [Streptomyces sp. NPDC088739]|uniref:terminase large subunit domain-containing protein n=1 Tax=Streptomyces sp. NPDC088739 TaxID=3365882 RepID=UPI00382E6A25
MTDLSEMSTDELMAEAARLAGLRTPATLGQYLDPLNFRMRAHTRVIGDALAGLGRDYRRLLLVTPPQIGKSTLAARWAPFWWLVQNPALPIVIASYGAGLATGHSRAVRSLVKVHGARFNMGLDRSTTAADEWYTLDGGGCKAVGVGSGVAGFPARRMVCDDPHSGRAEANSRTMRDRVWDWWSADLTSRMAPGTPVVLVQTAWHPDDLRGRLLKKEGRLEDGGEWKVVHLPAVADLALTPHGDPLGRQTGDPLSHPDIEDDDRDALLAYWVGDKQAHSKAGDWAALYQGDPQPKGGALLTEGQIHHRTHRTGLPPVMKAAVTVDPSGDGRDTCGIIGGYLGTDQRVYVTHDWTAVMPSTDWPRAACRLAAETDADRITLEQNFGGGMPKTLVRTAWDSLRREWDEANPGADREANPYRRLPPRITLVNGKRNKLLRAEPIAQQIIEDRFRFGGFFSNLAQQWTTWQPTDPDSPGALDACVYLGFELLPVPGANEVVGREDDRAVRIDDIRPSGWAARRID